MCMYLACLLAMVLGGSDGVASSPSEPTRIMTWDESARQLGRSPHAESSGPLITGVRAVPLMLAVLPKDAWKPREWTPGAPGLVTAMGVDYVFDPLKDGAPPARPGEPPQQVTLRIAVYRDRETAILAAGRDVLSAAMGPQPVPNQVGNVAYAWTSPQDNRTRVLFRRDNVVVSLRLPTGKVASIELASKLDAALAAGGPNVRKGDRVEAPQLILPASIRVALQERRHVKPELREGDVAELLIGTDDPHMIVMRSQGGKPELVYHAPRVAAEAGAKTVTVTVATPMNVVSSQRITVEVTAGP
jgi:hypothetical protein